MLKLIRTRGAVLASAFSIAIAFAVPAALAQVPVDEPNPLEQLKKKKSEAPDPSAGLQVARKLCSSCHLIGEPSTNAATPADVPSFPTVANRPDQSVDKLTGWLIQPHTPMPNLHLTRKEIRDLAAYIMSLRTTK